MQKPGFTAKPGFLPLPAERDYAGRNDFLPVVQPESARAGGAAGDGRQVPAVWAGLHGAATVAAPGTSGAAAVLHRIAGRILGAASASNPSLSRNILRCSRLSEANFGAAHGPGDLFVGSGTPGTWPQCLSFIEPYCPPATDGPGV